MNHQDTLIERLYSVRFNSPDGNDIDVDVWALDGHTAIQLARGWYPERRSWRITAALIKSDTEGGSCQL